MTDHRRLFADVAQWRDAEEWVPLRRTYHDRRE